MIQAKCIQKFRDNQGRIIGYILEDKQGQTCEIQPDELKEAIRNNQIDIDNLILTSDNRLVNSCTTDYSNYNKISTQNDFIILNKDVIVASFNSNLGNFEIYGNLPYGFDNLAAWIHSRYKFSCARDVRHFFNTIGIKNEIDFIDIVHCVSLHDTFWVKRTDDDLVWKDISPYTHNYSNIVSTYALDGIIIKDKSKDYFSPVIETGGTFPHTWIWKNNEIHFVKAGSKYTIPASNSGREPYSEYYASIIAKYLNFNSVEYTIRNHTRHDNKIDVVTECKIFTNEAYGSTTANNLNLLSYEDIIDYCRDLSDKSYNTILDMLFLDCLLLNTDRHFSNIEFIVNNDTQQIIDIAPIFDNNFALLPRFIENYDRFNRSDYVARDNRKFEDLYKVVIMHKMYTRELMSLKKLKLTKPRSVQLSDERLKFLNNFLQKQVDYLISLS